MFDSYLRPLIDPPLGGAARVAAKVGVTANHITVGGFICGLGAFWALAVQDYGWALFGLALNRLADGFDGAVARHRGLTDLGGFLDIVLDLIFYAGFVFFFALGRPDNALMAAFLIFSFMGTGASFLAFSVMAAKHGLVTRRRGLKSIYYSGGLAEGAETIAAFVLMCLMPGHFFWIAAVFGTMCWITTALRIGAAVDSFGGRDPVPIRQPQEAPPRSYGSGR